MKKTIFLWIAMLLGTASIFAQSGTTGSLGWTLDNGTLTISVTGAMKDYNGYSRAPWYSYRSSITTIVIGNGVTSIGDGAFSGCSSLTAVTIPNSVTSIGSYAFAICSSLTAVTIPNNVTSIGDGAFYGCSSLTAVTIPNSVTSIGESIFGNCSNLTAVITKSENEYFSSNNGVLFNKEQTILVCYPSGKKGNYII
ncbi:MAG: leucine-rich repeat domain-containing protein, partial [Prevotellaceae bacterium]|nr:leucine-rich repeat domain-containing protein [Prevotellaceae bacterium]